MTIIEKHGYWWLPEAPKNEVAGTVFYGHDTKSKLHLLGTFSNQEDAFLQMGGDREDRSHEIILGLTDDGKEITLYDNLLSKAHYTTNSFITHEYSPRIVLEGKHFSSVNEMQFHQLTMRLTHFGEWLKVTGKQFTFENPDSGKHKVILTYQRPDPLSVLFDGGYIQLGIDNNIIFSRYTEDFIISENPCISIYPNKPLYLQTFLEECLPPIISFFTLGIGHPLSILELRGKVIDDSLEDAEGRIKHAPTIQLFWKKKKINDDAQKLYSHHMIFTRPDILDDFEKHFRCWMTNYQEIKPVMQLFFDKVIEQEFLSTNTFLNSVQTAEAYHRYRHGGTDLPEIEHQKRINSIIDASPVEHRNWLTKKLQYSNEIGLRKRINELLTERKDLYEISSSDIKSYSHRITEIRNQFTHYSGEKDPDFATGHDLYVYTMLMFWTIVACLLEEMGIKREQAHILINKNYLFSSFKSMNLIKGLPQNQLS